MSRETESERTAYYLITAFIIFTTTVATLEAYGVDTGAGREDDGSSIISNVESILDNIGADIDRLLRPETEAKRNPIKRLYERSATTNRTNHSINKRRSPLSSRAAIDKNRDKKCCSLFFRFFSDDTPLRKHRQIINSKGKKSDEIKKQDAFPSELTHLFPRIENLVPEARISGKSVNEDGNRSRWERTCDVCRGPQCHCSKSAGKFADEWGTRSDAFDSEWMIPRHGYRFDPLEEVFRDETESLLDNIFDDVSKIDDDLLKMTFSFTDDEPNVIKIGSFLSGKENRLRGDETNKTGNNLLSFIDSLRSKRQAAGKTVSKRAKDYKAALKELFLDKSGNKRRVKKEIELAPPSANHSTLYKHEPENAITDDKNNTTTFVHPISNINRSISQSPIEVNNSTDIKDGNPLNITIKKVFNTESRMNSTDNLNLDNETLVTEITASPVLVSSESGFRKKADDLNSRNIKSDSINLFDEMKFDEINNLSMYIRMNTTDNETLETITISWPERFSSESSLAENLNSTNITSDLINLFDEMNNYGGDESAFQVPQSAAEIKLKRDGHRKESKWHVFLVVLAVIPGIVGLVVVIGIAVIWILQRRPASGSGTGTGGSGNESDVTTSQIPLSQLQPKSSVKC